MVGRAARLWLAERQRGPRAMPKAAQAIGVHLR